VYFRKRLVTVIGFMLCAAIGVDAPLPTNATNLRWVTFIVPAGYALWFGHSVCAKTKTNGCPTPTGRRPQLPVGGGYAPRAEGRRGQHRLPLSQA